MTTKKPKLRPRLKLQPKRKPQPKNRKKQSLNRRAFRRHALTDVWVVERAGDYLFLSPVDNLSLGGVLLKRRVKATNQPSEITLHLGGEQKLEVSARPLYDRRMGTSHGTAYRFENLSQDQTRLLRSYLRNLD